MTVLSKSPQRKKQEDGRDGGKRVRELSEVNKRAVSRGQKELIGKFKMTASDVIGIGG